MKLADYEERKKPFMTMGLEPLQQLADGGDPVAQNVLGLRYAEGTGAEENPELAYKYIRMAAVQGLDVAQDNLGILFLNGTGVSKSVTTARFWFSLSAAQGCEWGENSLRSLKQRGTDDYLILPEAAEPATPQSYPLTLLPG